MRRVRSLELLLALSNRGFERFYLRGHLREFHIPRCDRLGQRRDLLLRLAHGDLHLAEEKEALGFRLFRLLFRFLRFLFRLRERVVRGV